MAFNLGKRLKKTGRGLGKRIEKGANKQATLGKRAINQAHVGRKVLNSQHMLAQHAVAVGAPAAVLSNFVVPGSGAPIVAGVAGLKLADYASTRARDRANHRNQSGVHYGDEHVASIPRPAVLR
jgi:hypothetical protein